VAYLDETIVYEKCDSFEDYSKKLEALSPLIKYCEDNGVFVSTHHHPYYKSMAICLSINHRKFSRCKIIAVRARKMADEILGSVGVISFITFGKHRRAR